MTNCISIIINCDTRPGFLNSESTEGLMSDGTRSQDYLIDGVLNKKKFFKDFNHEVILFVDYHEPISSEIMNTLHSMLNEGVIQSLTLSKHREYYKSFDYYPKHNDLNYLHAVSLARGKYVCHFDSDMAAFLNDKSVVDNWLTLLDTDKYSYISYPSHWSPDAITDASFNYRWASTRFFLCKKDAIDATEIEKCLSDSGYLYGGRYDSPSKHCPWFEHVIGIIAGKDKVWYPPIDYNRCIIFSWNNYKKGTFARLNSLNFEGVKQFVMSKGGISYPCNLSA